MNDPLDGDEEARRLFHEHVPEVASGVVEIKGIARVRGQRTIVAVYSKESGVDAVGACVGQRGVRIKTIVQQSQGEKFDIVLWSDSIEKFLRNIFAPDRAEEIVFDEAAHRATIFTSPDFKPGILGPDGGRLKLVSRLVGWDLRVETG